MEMKVEYESIGVREKQNFLNQFVMICNINVIFIAMYNTCKYSLKGGKVNAFRINDMSVCYLYLIMERKVE